MSIYRFLLKIPLLTYGVLFVIIAFLAKLSFPFQGIKDTPSTHLSSLLNDSIFKLAQLSNIDISLLFLIIGLLTISVLIFLSIKIIKLKFYDLNFYLPIIAFLFTGPIIFSLIVDIKFLVSGLLTMSVFYFQLKYFDSQKIIDFIFLFIFSLLALSINNFYFLIIITIFAFFKIFNFKINKEEKINTISKLSIIYLIFFVFLIINLIQQSPSLININLNFKLLFKKLFVLLLMFLPLIGLFINALLFNIFKKVNWNKDLVLFLIIGVTSFIIYLFTSSEDISPLIFGCSIIVIYIFRTLEFVEFRWTKILFLLVLVFPVSIVVLDISLYQSKQDIPITNYILYVGLILIGLINPFFYFQKQTSTDILKISLFSISLNTLLVLVFIYFYYKNLFIYEVIKSSIENDLNCNFETTKLVLGSNDTSIVPDQLINNGILDNNINCEILINFNTLDNMPIENYESLNKTGLDLPTRKFININFLKI